MNEWITYKFEKATYEGDRRTKLVVEPTNRQWIDFLIDQMSNFNY